MNEKLVLAGALTGASAARGFFTASSVIIRDHRELSHGSAVLSERLARLFDLEQKAAGTNSNEWAVTHRMMHHQFPDVNLYPAWLTKHAIDNARDRHLELPATYRGYDPFVDEFKVDDIYEIGEMADDYLQEILKDRHWVPNFDFLPNDQLEGFLHNPDPKYYYDRALFNRKHIYDEYQAMHMLLRDQHSPALAPPYPDGSQNGVRWVFRNNNQLCSSATRLFRQRPHLFPDDLKPKNTDKPIGSNTSSVYAGFAVATTLGMLFGKDASLEGLVKSGVAGAFVNTFGLIILKEGTDTVNSFGHMGPMTPETIRKAIFNKNFQIVPNPDGTLAADTQNGGILGKLMSVLTYDESGKQRQHHLYPDQIAYQNPQGNHPWYETPMGSLLQFMASSKYVPFIREGRGVPLDKNGRRVDTAHPALEIIHSNRVRTMEQAT